MSTLDVGEKYLSVTISTEKMLYLANKAIVEGNDKVMVAAFPNKERTGNQPHFKNDGLAVWIQKKQAPKKDDVEEIIEELI